MKNNLMNKIQTSCDLSATFSISHGGENHECGLLPYQANEIPGWSLETEELFSDSGNSLIYDLDLSVEKTSEGTVKTVMRFNLELENWNTENYITMPACVYGGNRFPSRHMPYPPLITEPGDFPMDRPEISDVPRLGLDGEASLLQQTSGDMSTPAVGIFFPRRRKGLWLLTEQENQLGNYGFTLSENSDRSKLNIEITSPVMRKDKQYFGCGNWRDSEDSAAELGCSAKVDYKIRVIVFDAESVGNLFSKFLEVRNDLCASSTLKNDYPFSRAWKELEEKYNRDNWYSEGKFYGTVVKSVTHDWKWRSGWCGGLISTWPLLVLGDESSRKRALETLDTIFTKGMSPCGLFYSMGSADGERWQGNCFPYEGSENMHLIRRSGDCLYFAIKQLEYMKANEIAIPQHWNDVLEKCADALVSIWQKNGQFGHFVNQYTGEIIIGGSSAGGIVPAALALCYKYFGKDEYWQVAAQSAEFYRRHAIDAGLTTGGPAEILQCPDSESAFGLLESFVTLYEVSDDEKWLDSACRAADQCLSWCMNYDFRFPENSLFGKLGIHTAGSVWANVQNKHSAPGICTHSGASLLKLYRACGNEIYLDTIHKIAHNITQYVSRPERPIGEMPAGWINERVNTSDWEKNVGGIFHGSCWSEVSCMLTCLEIPGIYAQADTGKVCCFDHVEVKFNQTKDVLEISNPTDYDLETTILVENSSDCSVPLENNYMSKFKRVTIKAKSESAVKL